jgi:hypothetical protein
VLIDVLDQFENEWFPVTRFTLERNYPVIITGPVPPLSE